MENIRNFSIIAHIDHGKSTLADRILEITGAVSKREMVEQILDNLQVERERGITVKARSVTLNYKNYVLNLIDTPGHVDFTYEVSRSLSACEGAILLVDATQGVEAQTLSNAYLAISNNLTIIPAINKIDLPSAEPEKVEEQIETVLGIPKKEVLKVSAKTGEGVENLLEELILRIPPPKGEIEKPLKALIFDSWYDPYRGVTLLVRIVDGSLEIGKKILLFSSGREFEVERIGIFTPKEKEVQKLEAGMVGFLNAGIKDLSLARIGDTITDAKNPAIEPLPGFQELKPMVYAGLYPTVPEEFEKLRDSLEKLHLNDASFTYIPEVSTALGFGFRCGFLGILHMQIIQERLEVEFGAKLIITSPSVEYRVYLTEDKFEIISNPSLIPEDEKIYKIEEPFMEVTIFTPSQFLGEILKLCESKRGTQKKMEFFSNQKVMLVYILPLSEIIVDFYDKLKSSSKGYASMDYSFIGFQGSSLTKLNILVNGQVVDAFSVVVHKDKAYEKGRKILEKLRKNIPRQLFEVILQASIGKRIIAKERIAPLRKDVLAKCYGGDITRKKKLLEKQKEGKKRMKQIGKVEIPQEAFLEVLKID
ncbi:MAG: translation elongation factor 4 [Thermoanaerobaculia bacterium]